MAHDPLSLREKVAGEAGRMRVSHQRGKGKTRQYR